MKNNKIKEKYHFTDKDIINMWNGATGRFQQSEDGYCVTNGLWDGDEYYPSHKEFFQKQGYDMSRLSDKYKESDKWVCWKNDKLVSFADLSDSKCPIKWDLLEKYINEKKEMK